MTVKLVPLKKRAKYYGDDTRLEGKIYDFSVVIEVGSMGFLCGGVPSERWWRSQDFNSLDEAVAFLKEYGESHYETDEKYKAAVFVANAINRAESNGE